MLTAITLTFAAGLSTGIGGLIVLLCKKPTEKMLAASLGFAGGVMLTVSLMDMLPVTVAAYSEFMGKTQAALSAISLFICGAGIAWLLQNCLPEPKVKTEKSADSVMLVKAARSAMVTTSVIVLHNLPEGILTMFTGYGDPRLGLTLTLAIALHNIPEGIAVSMPIYYATGSKMKGLLASVASGLAEPVGAVLAFLFFKNFISPAFLDGMIATIAGIMCFVSYNELIPGSLEYGENKYGIIGMLCGTVVMSIGIFML